MKKKEVLWEELKKYSASDIYPFHMPGHKRNIPKEIGEGFSDPFSFDVTEVEGTDNLHHAEGILKEAMDHAACVYKTKKTFFLVNGSTCGILAAISVCVSKGDHILMAQNSHLCAYHAVELVGAVPVFLKPPVIFPCEISGSVDPEEVKTLLKKDKKIRAVFLTSPTYDGILSDIGTIAGYTHEAGAVLIVDEAHGAHLPFLYESEKRKYRLFSAAEKGADLVTESLHKTLPAFTQTALLHICSERVSVRETEKALSVFETSSPSYLLLSSIDACIRWMEKEGRKEMKQYFRLLEEYRKKFSEGKIFSLWTPDEKMRQDKSVYAYDPGKLLFGLRKDGLTGPGAAELLRKKYGIETEMAAGKYVLALSSLCDTQAGFERLYHAVREIDQMLLSGKRIRTENKIKQVQLPEGRIKDYIFLYPPGIPIALPGQVLNKEQKKRIMDAMENGCRITGLE